MTKDEVIDSLFNEGAATRHNFDRCAVLVMGNLVKGCLETTDNATWKELIIKEGGKLSANAEGLVSRKNILDEVERAETKWPVWPNDKAMALLILLEEIGEAAHAYLFEPYEDYIKELTQALAMAVRLVINLEVSI